MMYIAAAARLGNTRLGSIPGNLVSHGVSKAGMPQVQQMFAKDASKLANLIPGVSKRGAVHVGRFAGRAMPLLSALANIHDVSNIIAGPESFGNKAMDTAAMGVGAAIGGVMGGGVFSPLTASIGASTGKMISDGAQWLFGDKMSPEQRRAEEQARALYGGMG